MKHSNDTIDNRIRDLPDFSVVPQPIAPPRAQFNVFDASNSTKGYRTNQTEISSVTPIQKGRLQFHKQALAAAAYTHS
jgi:hypothetical protein